MTVVKEVFICTLSSSPSRTAVSWDARRLGVIASLQHSGLCVLEGAGTASCRGGGGAGTRTTKRRFFSRFHRYASPRVMRIFHHKDYTWRVNFCARTLSSHFRSSGLYPFSHKSLSGCGLGTCLSFVIVSSFSTGRLYARLQYGRFPLAPARSVPRPRRAPTDANENEND